MNESTIDTKRARNIETLRKAGYDARRLEALEYGDVMPATDEVVVAMENTLWDGPSSI